MVCFLLMAGLVLWGPLARAAADRADQTAERLRMVKIQIERRGIAAPAVLAAMVKVPRHRFVLPSHQSFAYADRPLPIGLGQTISQPYIVAAMTEALELNPGDKVLEIGTGSGYQAGILAEIVREVRTIEIFHELSQRAHKTLKSLGYKVVTRVGDGYLGWPQEAPFDKIIVTCAPSHVPPPLLDQLREGGRMVIPVGSAFQTQDLLLITKRKGKIRSKSLMPVRFVPLIRGRP